jgi:hypothetical protein
MAVLVFWRMSSGVRGSALALRSGVSAGIALAVVFAFLNPVNAFLGAWSTVNGARVLGSVTRNAAGGAQVVWIGSPLDDAVSRILLDFYRVGATSQRTRQSPLDVGQECGLLRDAAEPTVLSNRDAGAVRIRYACEPAVSVVQAGGS